MSDLSIQWLVVFVDASVKAVLLALVAAAGLMLLRVRDSNLRHRVWTGVLCGMLLLPVLTQIVPALRLPFTMNPQWFAALDRAEDHGGPQQFAGQSGQNGETAGVEPTVDQQPGPLDLGSITGFDSRAMAGGSDWPGAAGRWPGEFHRGRPESPLGPDDALAADPRSPQASVAATEPEPAINNEQSVGVSQPMSRMLLSHLALAFWSLWLAGGLALGSRLLAGLWMARILRLSSRPIAPAELPASITNAEPQASPRSSVPLVACPLIRVPLTSGVIRPQILLPLDWSDWSAEKLQAVLAHEGTHAERGDCAMALLAEVNRCFYWFHPLAWWLRRRLAALAEAACDDAAIGSTGDRASYARHLLEVAATARAHRGRLVAGGVSMARRSNVETRITAILDFTRPLSQRLTWGPTLVLLGTIIPVVALAAALRPSSTAVRKTGNSVPSPQAPTENKRESGPDTDVTFAFAGTIVDEQKQPVAGAKISLSYFRRNPLLTDKDAATVAITDDRGKFVFSWKASSTSDAAFEGSDFWSDAGLVAVKDGYGFAFAPANYFETTGRADAELNEWQREQIGKQPGKNSDVLTLVRDDVPIRGRILNAEGQPVVGATVEAFDLWEGEDGTLDAWEAATKGKEAVSFSAMRHLRQIVRGHWMTFNWLGGMGSAPASRDVNQGNLFTGTRAPVVPVVHTDANGWFTLKGMGRERIAEILISAPGIETTQQLVRSRPGDVVKLGLSKPIPQAGVTIVYYPNEFTLVSGASVPIAGRVADAKTGQPIAGVGVQSTGQFQGAVTDAAGKYRLEGLPLGTNSLLVTPPAGSRYLAGGVTVTTAAAAPPLVRDIALMPGVLVRGRVIDETTGKPLRGNLEYFAYETNPHTMESDSLRQAGICTEFHPDVDGRFEIPVLPGPGILGFFAGPGFPDAKGADQIDCPKQGAGDSIIFETAPRRCIARGHNLLVPINPRPEDDELTIDLALRSGLDVAVRVLAPDGKPVSGYRVFGARRHMGWPPNPGETFDVVGYSPTETRRLIVYHEGRDLVGCYELTGEPPKELAITLQPAATLIGRVLGADGSAFEQVNILGLLDNAFLRGKPSAGELAYGVFQMNAKTDSHGRFELKGIVPGLKHTAHLNFFPPFPAEKRLKSSLQGPIFADVVAKPGETKDLGDLRLELDSGMPATPVNIVHGRVTGPNGKPAARAFVAVVGSRIRPERGGDLSSRGDVMAEGATDDSGRFEVKLSGVSAKTHSQAVVIARSNDSGLTWRRIDPDARDVNISFELPVEQVIRGRLIDIEGQPAGGVRMSVGSLIPSSTTGTRVERVGFDRFGKPPQAWPADVIADENGRFVIRGTPADHGVYLAVEGTDRFAPQGLSINSGLPERRPNDDATYRELVRNFKPGEEAVLPLAPAQIFEGVIRFDDTGEPAPHARLTIWASQQEAGGSSSGLAGKADAQGRYRISPRPGVRFRITAYPPDGVPYLIRQSRDIKRKDGARVKQVDVSLPRGVLVRGRVVESGTKAPIADAAIQYVPERRNNPNATDDIVTGWEGIQLSGTDGAFEFAVLPGPGTLLIHGPNKQFVLQEIGSRELGSGTPGGDRNYAGAIRRVNPKPLADPLNLTFELRRGATISGRITSKDGKPVEHALLITRLNIHPMSLTWRGHPLEVLGGRFELSGLGEGVEYPVHFLDAKNRLGATALLKAGDISPTVVLIPCGEAVATFTDASGKPITNLEPTFEMVVTPGPHRFDRGAMRNGALAADAEFVVNIDRTNYQPRPKTDAEGRITFPALIPGASYRIVTIENGRPAVPKEFVAKSQKTLDLGKIVMAAPKEDQ